MTRSVRTLLVIVSCSTSSVWCQAPAIAGVVNAASYTGNLAPGALASIFGTNLAPSAQAAAAVPLPLTLNGVSVTVGGKTAPLWYVSAGQINLLIPYELNPTAQNAPAAVIVTTAAGASKTFNVILTLAAPALFTSGTTTGPAIAFDGNYQPVTQAGTAPFSLYATGLGPTNPPASSSTGGASTEPLNRVVDGVSVFVGDKKANVTFAGIVPGYQGFYQLNVTPNGATSDRVYVRVDGWQSNIASIPNAPGANVANVTGSIDGLYPSTTSGTAPAISVSVMLIAATFSASFDILPGAKPFSVVAASEAGTAEIDIDPVAGTWQETASVPSPAARQYNFGPSEFTQLIDFSTCSAPSVCSALAGNVVPLSRLDPAAIQAQNQLPIPNVPVSGPTAFGTYTASGTLSGTHFDASVAATQFGGFMQIPYFGTTTRTTTFRLYVDGKLVASKDASYTAP